MQHYILKPSRPRTKIDVCQDLPGPLKLPLHPSEIEDMTRRAYASLFTLVWAVILALGLHPDMTGGVCVPLLAILGAWLAVFQIRIGYAALFAMSIVIAIVAGKVLIALVGLVALHSVGGQINDLVVCTGVALTYLGLFGLHLMGLSSLRIPPAARSIFDLERATAGARG